MLLTIETTRRPATDLGYLLHKNPARAQTFDLAFGRAHVFYPVAGEDRCQVAGLLDVDPVALVRKRGSVARRTLEQYVNDRPYVASSFLSVALNRLFSTAMNGRSKERPNLVDAPLPLKARLAVLPCRAGSELIVRLFEPLGYAVTCTRHPLDEQFPDWGEGHHYTVELEHEIPLKTLLQHLYVLVPVLDNDKHYWVGEAEVDKLLARGVERAVAEQKHMGSRAVLIVCRDEGVAVSRFDAPRARPASVTRAPAGDSSPIRNSKPRSWTASVARPTRPGSGRNSTPTGSASMPSSCPGRPRRRPCFAISTRPSAAPAARRWAWRWICSARPPAATRPRGSNPLWNDSPAGAINSTGTSKPTGGTAGP